MTKIVVTAFTDELRQSILQRAKESGVMVPIDDIKTGNGLYWFLKNVGGSKCGMTFHQFFRKRLNQQDDKIAKGTRPMRLFSTDDASKLISDDLCKSGESSCSNTLALPQRSNQQSRSIAQA